MNYQAFIRSIKECIRHQSVTGFICTFLILFLAANNVNAKQLTHDDATNDEIVAERIIEDVRSANSELADALHQIYLNTVYFHHLIRLFRAISMKEIKWGIDPI